MTEQTYFQPISFCAAETEEKKSRFLISLYPATDRNIALERIKEASEAHPRANHHCYAFIVGSPFKPEDMAASDDGEPAGTAGRPMLSILQQQHIGDAVVIVTRYFGGIKLGTGGLVRAYSTGVKEVLKRAEMREKTPSLEIRIRFPYTFEKNIRTKLDAFRCVVTENIYLEKIIFLVQVPVALEGAVRAELIGLTAGSIHFID